MAVDLLWQHFGSLQLILSCFGGGGQLYVAIANGIVVALLGNNLGSYQLTFKPDSKIVSCKHSGVDKLYLYQVIFQCSQCVRQLSYMSYVFVE